MYSLPAKELILLYTSTSKENAHKAIFYKRIIFDFPRKYNCFLGTGPGTIGSRASNSRSYDMLPKLHQKIPKFIKPFTSSPAKEYLVDLYTKEFVESAWSRSELLGRPFAFYPTMLAETGYIGLIMYLLIIFSLISEISKKTIVKLVKYRSTLIILWVGILLLFFLDNYQEFAQIIMPLVILSALLISESIEYNNECRLVQVQVH